MEFLGIGPLELLVIFIIILLVMGPEDMQRTARTLGRWLRRLMLSEGWQRLTRTTRELRYLPNRLAREAGLEEPIKEIEETVTGVTEVLSQRLLDPETEKTLTHMWTPPSGSVPHTPPASSTPDPTEEDAKSQKAPPPPENPQPDPKTEDEV